ncbi:NB-ARC domain-containing protein [Streptomyces sp. NPDC002490]|uniref:ATP-binding protein n=1 Tax=Streptomyces sp. NPDC002490 TaxID=3154416 RepID=UPI003333AC61
MRAFSSCAREALRSAVAAWSADRDSPAWHALGRVVATAARANPEVARHWGPHATPTHLSPLPPWHELARELDATGIRDPATERALAEWLRHHPAPTAGPPTPTDPRPSHNVLAGNAAIHGPSVQARDIHGGVHFHHKPPARTPLPRQLPPAPPRFVDREADHRALDSLRARRPARTPQVLVVSGLAGVGKTSLATHWLHEHLDDFPDGQLHADLGGQDGRPTPPGTVLETFLIALGSPSVPAGLSDRSALWRSLTAGMRLAVMLDNAFTAAQVRPLLLGSPTGLVLVTSRSNLTGLRIDGAAVHRLDGLTVDSAVELLALGGGARVESEPDAAHEVVRLCGRLPLTVALASAQLAARPHRSVSALVDSLSCGTGAVDTLRVDGEAVMRTALDLSHEVLPQESGELYRRMGLLPVERHDFHLLTALTGEDGRPERSRQTADIAVHCLVEANLLEETGPGTYRFHDLVHAHAHQLGQRLAADDRDRVLRRFVDWCMSTAASAERILTPKHPLPGHDLPADIVPPTPLDGPQAALAWLDTHRNGLMGAVRHCAQVGWDHSCWRLTDLLWPLFLRLRPSELWLEAHRLGLEAARRSGSRPGEGRMLTSGAIGLRNAGLHQEAADWYRQALAMAVEDEDVAQQAQAVSGLGHLSLLARRLDEARTHFAHALELRESIGNRRGAALTRRRLGETALEEGDLATATRRLQRAAGELEALGETYEANRVRALLGHVLDRAGRHAEGGRLVAEALDRFHSGADRSEHWEARCLEWLGQAAENQGDRTAAALRYGQARDLFLRCGPADARRLEERLRRL